MSRLHLPAGASLRNGRRRLVSVQVPPRLLSDGADAATSVRAAVTAIADAAPHTPGAWVEVVAALSEPVGSIILRLNSQTASGATDTSTLLDVGVGPAGSEVVAVPSIGVGYTNTGLSPGHPGWELPVYIPAGSRVAVRAQSAVASKNAFCRIYFYALDGARMPSPKVVALGANLATSRGVTIPEPGALNTKGAWAEVIAATSEPYAALGIAMQGGGTTTEPAGTVNALVDIGMGPVGSETTIVPNLAFTCLNTETVASISPLVFSAPVPRGSRLAVRMQSNVALGIFDAILYGIRAA